MNRSQKYDRILTGILAGIFVPMLAMIVFWLWKSGEYPIDEFFGRLITYGSLTNAISVSVFANLFIFLFFNKYDMLKASKGILGITIVWAVLVFIIKFS